MILLPVFLRLVETSFSMKSFIGSRKRKQPGQQKWVFCQSKLICFVPRFFFPVETVTAISESQFLRKDHILTNVTDFLPSGDQLLPFFQKAVNCCQWKQFLLQLEHIHSANHLFWLVETSFLSTGNTIVLLRVFLCQ